MKLLYTICFCIRGDQMLMLYRSNPPNQHRWNGLGGKIEDNETPLAGVQREIMEEASINLQMARRLHFAGIVTWSICADPTGPGRGMYAFLADLPLEWPIWEDERATSEGTLCWKPIQWVCDPENSKVVSNIAHFLPEMLTQDMPLEYYCIYQGGRLATVSIRPLPPL